MKNPLADALRQSNGTDDKLSESGRFDTVEVADVATANDAQVVSDDAIDLQLLEATGALVLDNGTVQFEAHTLADDAIAETVDALEPAPSPRTTSSGGEPFASRFAPLICLAAAIIAAGGWLANRQLQGSNTAVAPEVAGRMLDADSSSVAGTVRIAGAERFPFIDPDVSATAGDAE